MTAPPASFKSRVAPILLFSLILIIGIGPRIHVGFVDAEIRVQDVLLLPILGYLAFSRKPTLRFPLDGLLGALLPIFVWASFITVVVAVYLYPEVSLLRRVTYYGRTLEMLVLASVVAGLYLRSARRGLNAALSAVTVGALLNIAWFGYQQVTGVTQTLLGQDFSAQVGSYGPQLIGEPSPFGTGQYWAFVGAVAAARIKSNYHSPFSVVLLAVALTGAWLAESRISVGSILVILAVMLLLGKDRKSSVNLPGIVFGLLIGVVGLVQLVPNLEGRVTPELIAEGFQFRMDNIWAPFIDVILASPLVGIGPGGITGERYLSEAHNIILRAMLDFGIVVGVVFIIIFIRAMLRGFALARTHDADQTTRIAGYLGAFCVLSTLVSGLVQDALTAVMPAHLTMVAIGILAAQQAVWLNRSPHPPEVPARQPEFSSP